jgi:pimeloyl-ACP methyl ester carboxylesterase
MNITYPFHNITIKKHLFSLPLDYSKPHEEKIDLFVRELSKDNNENLPYLLFFQGGPGIEATRPESIGGWIKRALEEYNILLLDQRGTGLSSPVNYISLANLSASKQAEYLSMLRLDNIVRDAHAIKQIMSPNRKWSILGQSYGGFCAINYLSSFPNDLEEVFITGGIPPISPSDTADRVYDYTYKRVLKRNLTFYEKFPDAEEIVSNLCKYITKNKTLLPTGDQLTPDLLALLGINFGMEGGFESIYYLLESSLINYGSDTKINPSFLYNFYKHIIYHTNPLYALIHESIYCQGTSSEWSAERKRKDFKEFTYKEQNILFFTGEMIYPWMLSGLKALEPLKEAAEILAYKADWPNLYDEKVLKNNQVPTYAIIYDNDMYVEKDLGLETASKVSNLTYFIDHENEHSALRMHGKEIFEKLLSMRAKAESVSHFSEVMRQLQHIDSGVQKLTP